MAESTEQKYFDQLAQTIIDGDEEKCIRVIEESLANGIDPLDAVEKGLAKGINKIGDDFAEEIVFLPELIMAADAMKAGMKILDEKIKAGGRERKSLGKIVVGTIKGDIHDIGKSLVAAVLQANGYDVIDLGVDVDEGTFIQALIDNKAECLAPGALADKTIWITGGGSGLGKAMALRFAALGWRRFVSTVTPCWRRSWSVCTVRDPRWPKCRLPSPTVAGETAN